MSTKNYKCILYLLNTYICGKQTPTKERIQPDIASQHKDNEIPQWTQNYRIKIVNVSLIYWIPTNVENNKI